MYAQGHRLGGEEGAVEVPVHEKAPHVAVGGGTDKGLDVGTPVAEDAPFAVRFGDSGLEGHNVGKPGLALDHHLSVQSVCSGQS